MRGREVTSAEPQETASFHLRHMPLLAVDARQTIPDLTGTQPATAPTASRQPRAPTRRWPTSHGGRHPFLCTPTLHALSACINALRHSLLLLNADAQPRSAQRYDPVATFSTPRSLPMSLESPRLPCAVCPFLSDIRKYRHSLRSCMRKAMLSRLSSMPEQDIRISSRVPRLASAP